MRLTNDVSVSERASIAVLNEKVYVVWQDERDNDKEIYFNRSPLIMELPGLVIFD